MRSLRSVLVLAWLGSSTISSGCRACRHELDHDDVDRAVDEGDDPEEQDEQRDNFWRAQIVIVGQGTVRTTSGAFDCRSRGSVQSGACGPVLVRFKEREPPLLHATGDPGWRFDHWESTTLAPDGSTRSRTGPMPDGPRYLNGFGYADTHEVETVTAVFVRASSDAGVGDDASRR